MGLRVQRRCVRDKDWDPGRREADHRSCALRRRTPPVVPPPAREDRTSLSRERSTSRGRGAARSSSRESGRGARGRGRPARPSPSPTGVPARSFPALGVGRTRAVQARG
jgi:hypothetical protein